MYVNLKLQVGKCFARKWAPSINPTANFVSEVEEQWERVLGGDVAWFELWSGRPSEACPQNPSRCSRESDRSEEKKK